VKFEEVGRANGTLNECQTYALPNSVNKEKKEILLLFNLSPVCIVAKEKFCCEGCLTVYSVNFQLTNNQSFYNKYQIIKNVPIKELLGFYKCV
jgi:hypothetical protein